MFTALLALSLTAPVPKAKVPDLYFPTVVGAKKVMKVTMRGGTSETTETVTKVVEQDGVYTVTTTDDLRRKLEFGYEVSAKGLFFVSNPTVKRHERERLLLLPAKEGDTWTAGDTKLGRDPVATSTVGPEEDVEVPAGKFKAITVTTELTLNGGPYIKAKNWYAAGVGVVKRVTEVQRDELLEELKEYTPGK